MTANVQHPTPRRISQEGDDGATTPPGTPPPDEQALAAEQAIAEQAATAFLLEQQDAQERGHITSPMRLERDDEASSEEEPSPAVGRLLEDEPLSQAAVARMQKERLEQLVIIVRPAADDNSYLFGREDDAQLRQQNAKQISDQIFSYEACHTMAASMASETARARRPRGPSRRGVRQQRVPICV